MPVTALEQPLHVDTQHDDRQVVLGCDACDVRQVVPTSGPEPLFTARISRFFDAHVGCLTG